MPTERNEEIRERAYSLWEAEGRLDGKAMDYWLRAERDLAGAVAKPARKSRSTAKTASAPKKAVAAKASTKSTSKAPAKKAPAKKTASRKAPTAKA